MYVGADAGLRAWRAGHELLARADLASHSIILAATYHIHIMYILYIDG